MKWTEYEEQRFWSRVRKTDECWLWLGELDKGGYGRVEIQGKMYKAHRVSFWTIHPEFTPRQSNGLVLDHTCKTRRCVNPDHLKEVSQIENVSKTVCIRGHELTEENTGWDLKNGKLYKRCKACQRERYHSSRARPR